MLACSSRGEAVGAALGNDVNLRDFEGRSALLLSKAKDNNASCAIGPFVRLFDASFGLDDVRRAQVRLDGRRAATSSASRARTRWPASAAIRSTWSPPRCGPEHQYPDGFMLFLGTMYVPTADRRGPGQGFTHEAGDVVRISLATSWARWSTTSPPPTARRPGPSAPAR